MEMVNWSKWQKIFDRYLADLKIQDYCWINLKMLYTISSIFGPIFFLGNINFVPCNALLWGLPTLTNPPLALTVIVRY